MQNKIHLTQNLFCQKYWQNILNTHKKKLPYTKVSTSFDITDINRVLLGQASEKYAKNLEKSLDMSIVEFIKKTDIEFKSVTPLKEDKIVWRGIPNPGEDKKRCLRYGKALNTKAGDIICMPEYAYASDEKTYAQGFAGSNGILYEIQIPKGAKISRQPFIFPRYSKFKCIDIVEPKESVTYKLIKLIYINPKSKTKENSFWKRFL